MALLLAIEALDEVVFGVREAAWPLIRRDLGLGYADIGFLLAVPGVLAAVVEPVLGLLSDSGRRRLLVVAGGLVFAAGLGVIALASGLGCLMAGLIVIYPASGAFVALSQASLMDLEPERHEVNMARWTLAGSVGAVLGPLLLTAALTAGFGWRWVFFALALLMLPLVASVRSIPSAPAAHESFLGAARGALLALRRRDVIRWLVVLEATDLMGDVLLGYLALYFVDVAGLSPPAAVAAIVVWTVAGLAGDALLLPVLARIAGLQYLRVSAVLALATYPAFLLAGPAPVKVAVLALIGVLHAGWYAIPQGRLYTELGDTTGTAVALSSLATAAGSLLPLAIGVLAERAGLEVALWIALLAPLTLLLLARPEATAPPVGPG
ncbi:MAG TPA: MFS transporter [Candidatus Eisenbacteria bacterium]|nr:MFS transporter [Candidatus Eisenbacteria bacterium]